MKKLTALLLAAVMLLCFAACGTQGGQTQQPTPTAQPGGTSEPSGTADEIKIGVLLPLSGASASPGGYQLEGFQMAVDYVNENGGIASMGGAKVRLVVSDTTGDIETGITECERLITVENVSALCGPFNSTVGAATAPIAIQYGVPYVITNAIADNIMQSVPNKYVYRVNFGSADISPFRTLVEEYIGTLTEAGKLDSIAIAYDASDWGVSEYETYSKAAESLGIKVAAAESIPLDSTDLSSVVNKFKNSDAQVVFCGLSLNTAVLLTKTMHEYDCDIQICGSGTGFSDPAWLASIGAEAAEGVMGTTAFNPMFGTREGEPTRIYEEYLKTHDAMPEETINGFCGMATLLVAMETAGSADREAVADALYSMDLDSSSMPLWFTMFDGVNFNTEGDELGRYNQNSEVGATAGQILAQVIDGKWQLIWPTERATADPVFHG